MTHEQQEKVKALEQFILKRASSSLTNHVDQEILDQDKTWNVSYFFARLLYLARPLGYELSLKEFNKLRKAYEKKHGRVKLDELFEKYWLREILGFVEVAGTVSSVCFDFKKISNYKQELTFLVEYVKTAKELKNIPSQDFAKAVAQYEKKHELTLNKEGLYQQSWLREKDRVIELSNIERHYKPYLSYWNELSFLSTLYDRAYKSKKFLSIKKQQVEEWHKSFQTLFLGTPSLNSLSDAGVLVLKRREYLLNFYAENHKYWSNLSVEITGHYWQMLLDDISFKNDQARIQKLMTQTAYWEHSDDFLSHVTEKSKLRFLDAAFELVANEPDWVGLETERGKISIDERYGSDRKHLLFEDWPQFSHFTLENIDAFELLDSLELWSREIEGNDLYDQRSRRKLSYLTGLLVKHDLPRESVQGEGTDEAKVFHYRRIMGLLENCLDKPGLLWTVKNYIVLFRREFVAFLLTDHRYVSLALKFMDAFELEVEDKPEVNRELWIKGMEIGLITLRSNEDEDLSARSIFQVFRQLHHVHDEMPFNRSRDQQGLWYKDQKDKEKLTLSLIENASRYNHSVHGSKRSYWLPSVFCQLCDKALTYSPKTFLWDGRQHFPLVQWQLIAWLLQCVTYWKYKEEIDPDKTEILVSHFANAYQQLMETNKAERYDFKTRQRIKYLPTWSEGLERPALIEWLPVVYFLHQEGRLNDLLSPKVSLRKSSSGFDDHNYFQVSKLRTHVAVLLEILRNLVKPVLPFGFSESDTRAIKSQVEAQIINIIRTHIRDQPERGKVDLFNSNREHPSYTSAPSPLLPKVAHAINYFEQKQGLVEAIARSGDISKMLALANEITSEGIQNKLIEKIAKSNIRTFLEEHRSDSQIQQVLLQMSEYSELVKKVEEVADYWEQRRSAFTRERAQQLFQTRLYLAYHRKDEEELNSVQEPEKSSVRSFSELGFRDLREFYRALILIQTEPKRSAEIFDGLSQRFPEKSHLAVNRLAARLELARETAEIQDYQEAWEEWKAYAERQSHLDDQSLGTAFQHNRLSVLLNIRDYTTLEEEFWKLPLPDQMRLHLLEMMIRALMEQGKMTEVFHWLDEAENYHRYTSHDRVERIHELRQEANGRDDLSLLQNHYGRIFGKEPEKLIQVFPESLNGKRQLDEFIAAEILRAAGKMLEKIVAIETLESEDKYNDLIQQLMNARFSSWGWQVNDQSRGGYPATGKKGSKRQPGERDLLFLDAHDSCLGLCEAFVFRSKTFAFDHLKKIFNYHHQHKNLFILVYKKPNTVSFERKWKEYQEEVVPASEYPNSYTFLRIEDVSTDFNCDQGAVRVARSEHDNSVNLWHVFVNLNYEV